MLFAEISVELETVASTDREHEAQAAKRVLEGEARKEWGVVSLAAARALKRHLTEEMGVVALRVIAKVGDGTPELLVLSGDDNAS